MKDPWCCTDRPIIRCPRRPKSGYPRPIGDLLFTPYITADSSTSYDSVDIGHIRPVHTEEDDTIRWWTIRPPHPFGALFADPSEDILTLFEYRSPELCQVISITSGDSLIGDGFLEVPAPGTMQPSNFDKVHIRGDCIAHTYTNHRNGGITIVGWRDGVVRVVSFKPFNKQVEGRYLIRSIVFRIYQGCWVRNLLRFRLKVLGQQNRARVLWLMALFV